MRSMVLGLLLCACGQEEVVPREPPLLAEDTTPCATDEDCAVSAHGSCWMNAYCSHIDNPMPTPDIVCTPSEVLPVARDCVCEGTCVVR